MRLLALRLRALRLRAAASCEGWAGWELEGAGAAGVRDGASVPDVLGVRPVFSSAFSCSTALMTWLKIRAGIVPPSTGAPPYSVNIGVVEFACPTHTATVTSLVAPTNQASPLFSVVPVLPHSLGSPV